MKLGGNGQNIHKNDMAKHCFRKNALKAEKFGMLYFLT